MFINHCHVGPEGNFGGEKENDPRIGSLPALQEILTKAGVDKAVIFAPFGFEPGMQELIDQGVDRNEWLVSELKKYPNLIGFATVYPQDHDSPRQLKRAVEMGLRGAKVHPAIMRIRLDDPSIEKFWQTAEELKIPVSIHTGPHGGLLSGYMPILLDEVAQKHPDLALTIEHIGGIAFFDQALAVLHNNKNCYVGLTSVSEKATRSFPAESLPPKYFMSPEKIKILLDTVSARRIIYGFDYPWHARNLEVLQYDIKWINSWDISEEDKQGILGGNLQRLIGK